MRQFKAVFKYIENIWIANCEELRTTLSGDFFDALVARMKIVIQDIVQVEQGYVGDIQLLIVVQDRIDEIKAVG